MGHTELTKGWSSSAQDLILKWTIRPSYDFQSFVRLLWIPVLGSQVDLPTLTNPGTLRKVSGGKTLPTIES